LGPDVFSNLDDLAKKVSLLEPEVTDEVISKEKEIPYAQEFRPGLRLHQSKNTGFSVFNRKNK
jgi:hypothetical protein